MADGTDAGGGGRRRRWLSGTWWSWQGAVKIGVLLVLAIGDVFLFLAVGRDQPPDAQGSAAPVAVILSSKSHGTAPSTGTTTLVVAASSRSGSRMSDPKPTATTASTTRREAVTASAAAVTAPSTPVPSAVSSATRAPRSATRNTTRTSSSEAPSTTTTRSPSPEAPNSTTGSPAAPSTTTLTVTAPPSTTTATSDNSGPGASLPGVLLVVTPRPDGDLEVSERVLLPAPTTRLTLAPPAVRRAGPPFSFATAAAVDVQASAGTQPLLVPGAAVHGRTQVTTTAADRFSIRYRLTGATVRSTPSTAGRALAAIAPITADLPADLPVVIVASGSTVLGVNCPLLALDDQSCGVKSAQGWGPELPLTARSAVATVQFDLPMS